MSNANVPLSSQRTTKFWVREASMKRLNMLLKNKQESLTDVFLGNDIKVENLEQSGLSEFEVHNLEKWACGQQSGRQCMIALVEHNIKNKSTEEKFTKITLGAEPRPTEFCMLSSTLSLPEDFLCDSGYLYEHIFHRPPLAVIREAVEMLMDKAMEKNLSSLRVDQINLALKQLRIDNLNAIRNQHSDDNGGDENSNENVEQKKKKKSSENAMVSEVSSFRLSILIELIRIHIQTSASAAKNEGEQLPPPPITSKTSQSSFTQDIHQKIHHPRQPRSSSTSSSSKNGKKDETVLEISSLVHHLETPISQVIEHAEALTPDALEATNILLKPYIRQLSSLKASLSTQLKNFEDSRAYFSLGVSSDAPDAAIKKAYHSKAIQLHPDKPGGDTAKFQALQTSYHEILEKRRREEGDAGAAERVALDPKVQAEDRAAREILSEIAICLDTIQNAANCCTQLGQLNIRFLRAVEEEGSKPFPDNYKSLLTLMKYLYDENSAESANKKKPKKSSKKSKKEVLQVDIRMCSPSLGIEHLETVSETVQRLSALSMKLPACGFRFGLATAIHSGYMRSVENAMGCGLSAMKLIPSLLTSEDSIITCEQKIQDCKALLASGRSNGETHMERMLVEMIMMSFGSASRAVSLAAEKCVDAAILAAELYSIASTIVESGEEEAIAEEKRASVRKEKEQEMCEEDILHMAEKTKRDRQEMAKQMEEEETERRRQAEEREKDEEKDVTVEVLRVKIRSLQVQLRVQHVQALQSLNSETKSLQQQLQRQLREMVVSSMETDSVAAEIRAQREKDRRQIEKQKLQDELEAKAKSGETITSATEKGAQLSAPPLKLSLLSLLAEFIDSSCNLLREEILLEINTGFDNEDGESASHSSVLLHRFLGWMQALTPCQPKLVADTESDKETATTEPSNPAPEVGASNISIEKEKESSSSLHDIDDDGDETSNNCHQQQSAAASEETEFSEKDKDKKNPIPNNTKISVSQTGVKLALLPDYRSKTLWLSALVDEDTVIQMVNKELLPRLQNCFTSDYPMDVERELQLFCEQVLSGVKAAVFGLKESEK